MNSLKSSRKDKKVSGEISNSTLSAHLQFFYFARKNMKKNAFTPYIYRIFIFAACFLHTEGGWIENATAAKDQRPMLAVCALPTSLLLQKEAAKGRVFIIELSKVSGSALVAEICTGPHNRLLRRQHCSSLCSQSEGHEHVANMTSALGHDFVGFSARAWPP